jgi:hypothetical protein
MRLTPIGGDATLLNISLSGLLARCASRVAPGMSVKVAFEGTLRPALVEGRVARCEVAGIARNGAIQYHVGVAFNQPISLPDADEAPVEAPAVSAVADVEEARNRW